MAGGGGRLIALEGIDGAGKSTLAKALLLRLQERGLTAFFTPDTGDTPIGDEIRAVIQSHREPGAGLVPWSELLLFVAARAQHYAARIEPALRRGEWVLCDRYIESSLAYQGGGRGMDRDQILSLHRRAGMRDADLVLYLDVSPQLSSERLRLREERGQTARDRMETEGAEFFAKVRQMYLQLCEEEPQRRCRLDGGQDEQALAQAAWRHIEPLLEGGA